MQTAHLIRFSSVLRAGPN